MNSSQGNTNATSDQKATTSAVEKNPNNIVNLNKDNTDIDVQCYIGSIAIFDAELRGNGNPNDFWPHCNKGNALNGLGCYSAALRSFDAALRIDPNSAYAHCRKGISLLKLGRYNEALVCFDVALKIDPNNDYTKEHKQLALNQKSQSHKPDSSSAASGRMFRSSETVTYSSSSVNPSSANANIANASGLANK